MINLTSLAQRAFHDLNAASTLLLVVAAVLLWFKPGRGRAQGALALVIFVWSIPYLLATVAGFMGFSIAPIGGVLSVPYLVGGTFYMILLLLLPLDLIKPGWVRLGRVLCFMSPFFVISATYYLVTHMLGETVSPVWNYHELWHLRSSFAVWFRLPLLLMYIGYVCVACRLILRALPHYIEKCGEELGEGAERGLHWLRFYGIWLALLMVTYCFVIFVGGVWPMFIHTLNLVLFFIYVFFKSWNHVSPYIEIDTSNDPEPFQAKTSVEAGSGVDGSAHFEADDLQFEDKIPDYRSQVEEWFKRCRPYLNADFKLIDVMSVLPLNRTYLSRVFNEGFGANFSAVVRSYRLRHAEKLLTDQPQLSIVEVARQSGFSSSSVFHRAFVGSRGITPVQFRKNMLR